ncbi:hypothetical protein ACFFHM_18910 [Halalkalibacter kiskunsagensis]|jgi:hypothetical protein|uniref:Uncharacterized protein n=1 Tax=Halalkalibacter kiskunsagensis TaxID=1548599 RepID=A0ABV6KGP7_9BACI
MSHTFDSINDKEWLKETHLKRSNRSVELGKQAINELIKQGKPVTYKNISNLSKELDPEGKGIHPNTIRTNDALYGYYKQHSKTYKQKENGKNLKPQRIELNDNMDFRKIKPDRKIEKVQRNYMKLSKQELVQRLILAEQYIAENNTKWVANYFEMFK